MKKEYLTYGGKPFQRKIKRQADNPEAVRLRADNKRRVVGQGLRRHESTAGEANENRKAKEGGRAMTPTGRLNYLLDHFQGTPDAAAAYILWSSLCADRTKTREQVDFAATWLADQLESGS